VVSEAVGALVQSELPAQTSLRDHGTHRLKDLVAPEHVFELVLDEAAYEQRPLRSLDSRLANLPQQLTTFVGRETELGEVRGLLEAHRLVTITGAGGIGKTRLAVQAASTLTPRFGDGVYFVDLAPTRDADRVLAVIAETLGVVDSGGVTLANLLAEYVGRREMLLVLDNLEQVLGAAPDVARLLGSCPVLRILVTSRAPLRVHGERAYPLEPLRVEHGESDSVALFVDRAADVGVLLDPADASVLESIIGICLRCDGIPLAIELAASRTRTFALPELAAALDDAPAFLVGRQRDGPDRHAALSSAIAWSEGLLTSDQRRMFAALSVFSGGFGIDAMAAVAAPLGLDQPTDDLEALVEHALVHRIDATPGQPARFTLYEPIRQFAAARLANSEDAAPTATAHAKWATAFLRDEVDRFAAGEGEDSLHRLRMERSNARAAMVWSLANDPDAALELALPVALAFDHIGDWADGLQLVLPVVTELPPQQSTVMVDALLGAARLSGQLCRYDEAEGLLARARDVAAILGDPTRQRTAAALLAGITSEVARYDESLRWAGEALELARQVGQDDAVAGALFRLAATESQVGSLDDARRHLQDALAIARSQRLQRLLASELAFVAALGGDIAEGWRLLERSKGPSGEHEAAANEHAQILETMGRLWMLEGELDRAEDALRRCLAEFDAIGDLFRTPTILELLAEVLAKRRDIQGAALLLGTAAAIRDATGAPVPTVDRQAFDRLTNDLESNPEAQLATMLARGRRGLMHLGRLTTWLAARGEAAAATVGSG
jgi:predicted ATPase/predicted negative regulator of RcsB-dependent stress response